MVPEEGLNGDYGVGPHQQASLRHVEPEAVKYNTAVPIGRGGMGEVVRAWDPTLNRHVALKFLRSDDPELEERMLREARVQASVSHPNVCPVYEVGRDEGRIYIAMQYIDGRPLDEAARGLGLEQKVALVRTVAEAVHAAHAVGLVHRDLKPANILVERTEDGELKPWVVDFGIAREREVEGATVTGQVLGTPGYLSPEQAMGEVSTIDRRSDVFSLGVVLYELLSGSRPHGGDSDVEALVSLLEGEPVPLRKRAPHVPGDLETVVMTCLEHDRERRYDSARALADDLGRFLDGEPVQARPVGPARRIVIRARKHPKVTAAAAASVIAIVVLLGLVAHSRWSASQRIRVAQRFGQEVERVESLAQHAFLLPLHDTRPELAQLRERLNWIEAEMHRLGEDGLGVGHDALGRGDLALGDVELARRHLEQAWAHGERTPRVAFALGLSLAQLYREALEGAAEIRNTTLREDRVAEARRELGDPALTFLEQSHGGAEHPEYLAAWIAFAADDTPEALAHLERLRAAEPFVYQGDLLAGAVQRRLYQEAVDSGASDAASAAFEAAEEAFTAAAVVGRSDPRPYEELCALWVQAIRIQYYSRGGDLRQVRDAALDACGRALVANPDSVTAHLESGRANRFWASREVDSGRDPTAALEAARAHAQRALELDPESDDAYILLGVCHRIAANMLAEAGGDPRPDLLAAAEAYGEAIRLRPDDYGAVTSLAAARLHLGADARARGEDPTEHFASAADAARRATELYPKLVGAWVNLGIAEGQIGLWYRDTGGAASEAFGRGAEALRRAIEVNPEFYTAHYNLGEMLVEQAEGELRQGRDPAGVLDEAEPLLEVCREKFAGFAAPGFLLAKAAAMRAEHARRTGQDPTEGLGRAREAAEAARAVRADDATGLVMASLGPLVEARWQLGRGVDPSAQVERGLALVRDALAANRSLTPAWVRRVEFELVAAGWAEARGRPPDAALERAAQSLSEAEALNGADASVHTVAARLWRRRAERRLAVSEDPSAEIAAGLGATSRALAIDQARAAAHAERARLELLAGRRDAAEAAWADTVRLDPLLAREAPPELAAVRPSQAGSTP